MVACRFAQMKLFQKYSAVILVFAIFLITGCQTPEASKPITANDITPAPLYVTQGDVLEITFPGAKELSGQHKVGADGTITLPLVGQVVAALEHHAHPALAEHVDELVLTEHDLAEHAMRAARAERAPARAALDVDVEHVGVTGRTLH